jgi:hypothetical protein
MRSGLDVEHTMRALFPAVDTPVPGVPAWLGQVLSKATAFAVADRYDDAASMAAALRHTSRQNRGAARRVVPTPPARPQPSIDPGTAIVAPYGSGLQRAAKVQPPKKRITPTTTLVGTVFFVMAGLGPMSAIAMHSGGIGLVSAILFMIGFSAFQSP